MISALRSEPGIFSVTLVTGFATGFGTLMCQGSMLWLFGSAWRRLCGGGRDDIASVAVSDEKGRNRGQFSCGK